MDDCKDEKCPFPRGDCKIVPTHEVTPNGFDIVQDKENSFICHVLQRTSVVNDGQSLKAFIKIDNPMEDLKEFEEIRLYFETCSKHQDIIDGERFVYSHAEKLVAHAMKEWRKRHTEQNSGLSVEVFDDSELSDNIKSNVCGFGDEE